MARKKKTPQDELQKLVQPVHVVARTIEGNLYPMQVRWQNKNYAVANVLTRKVTNAPQGQKVEIITVNVIAWKEMVLEYNHHSRNWLLLTAEET